MGLIFFGPPLIVSATTHFSEGRVNLTRVKISPKLKITAGSVDFALPVAVRRQDLSGVSRALTLDWRIKNGLEFVGTIGPSRLDGYGTLSAAKFKLKPTSFFDWSNLILQIDFQKFIGFNLEMPQGDFTGVFNKSEATLSDMKITIPKIQGEVGHTFFEAEAFSVKLDAYAFGRSLKAQELELKYNLQKLHFPEGSFGASLFEGDIDFSNGDIIFDASASDAYFAKQKLTAKSLSLSTRQSLLTDVFDGAWLFSISEIELKFPWIEIEEYGGHLTFTPLGISHTGRAVISKLELETDKYFIGQIDNGTIDVEAVSRVLPSGLNMEVNGLLNLKKEKDFSASASLKVLTSEPNLLGCIGKKCEVTAAAADYHISVLGASLKGSLKCRRNDCFKGPEHHALETDNTAVFFNSLSTTGILSPVALPMAYWAISSGQVAGDGHILKF